MLCIALHDPASKRDLAPDVYILSADRILCRTLVTTAECLLNKNRNPSMSKQEIEAELDHQLGIKKVLWLPKVKHSSLTPSWR